MARVHRCVLERPSVGDSRVEFQWVFDGDSPLQRQTRFHLTYPGLDLELFSVELWLEIFLALHLKVLASLAHPVVLVLPVALPATVVDFWRAFHRADRVVISPVTTTSTYGPTRLTPPDAPPARRNALFYGGGKDSLVGALLLAELEGAQDLLLINFAAPGPGFRYEFPAAASREATILAPARRRLGVATAAVVTDYQSIFTPGAEALLPHVELYTAGALPWLIHHGVLQAFFTYGRNAYRVSRPPDGAPSWSFSTSRREVLVAQSAH